jgi:hypothetical protein
MKSITDELDMDSEQTRALPHRSTGLLIGIGAVASVLLMLRHPSIRSHEIVAAIAQICEAGTFNAFVHGGLLVVMTAVFAGLLGFAEYLGWSLARVRAGAVFHGCGVVCMIGAALINGFVVTGIARTYLGQADAVIETAKPVLVLCHEANQALAQAGTIAMSIAIGCWSLVLLGRGSAARIIGAVGLLVGVIPVVGLLSGHLRLDVHGMGVVVIAQAAWNVCVAVWCSTR